MKYKKGDKVRFLNDVGEGVVTKLASDGTIFVLDTTGFEVPAAEDELIMIKTQASPEAEQEVTENEPESTYAEPDFYPEINQIEGNEAAKAYFALVPREGRDKTDADLDAYLINDCNYIIFYNLIAQSKNSAKGIDAGIVEPNTKLSLFTLLRQEIGQSPDYIFQLIFYLQGEYQPVQPVEQKIVISPVKLYKEQTFKANEFFHEKAIIFDLTKPEKPESETISTASEEQQKLKELERMLKTKKLTDKKPPQQPEKKEKEDKREIDLHINELVDNTKGLTNGEILEIQMKKFHDEMKRAINDNLKRIIFIHGIGNGTLKNTLRKTLTQQYSKYAFHDASYKEYGFGATLVVIRN